ncbi:acyltransferase domain-containing protein [Micromonospora sp. B11E3]|uniref:acyltransferase domain-containing protein n=1 Tax=Micromonospora sp. B11E3 TaxID=3153562 RepID=UPI00325E66D1
MPEPDPGPAELPLALLLPGQGSQYPGMGTGLYRDVPAFAAAVDEVLGLMGPAGAELRADWLSDTPRLPLDHVTRAQPLLFAIDYALGSLVVRGGRRPTVLLGHSIGEVAAAALSGVFTLDNAVRLVMDRIVLLAHAPPGGMVAVAASREEVVPYLSPGVDVGAINAPRQTVLAGAAGPLRRTTWALRRGGFTCTPVASLTPFHSEALRPLVERSALGPTGAPVRPPAIPIVSGYTAGWLTGETALDPAYWTRHPAEPVLFWPALEFLLAGEQCLLLECGPGQGLTTLARRHPVVRSGRCPAMSLLGPRTPDPENEVRHFLTVARTAGLKLP